ncbi:hypothetical protein SAMN05216389_10726 [Oceanobacillus limi]|uniref:DUF4179 domain-containing protein n=1 Tax=Oceanobacillus limi TaxID=930131 RepID=A0A1I0CS17_9BACI|nr:hypothetical protein [Oceanobacillus limi]SET21857.1 hypothetical protein SAMN05216389_10726 [Oceanobacillus limi]
MSKLSKKDFDNYLGKDAYYSNQDKERFYNTLHQPTGYKKHWFPQLLTAAFLIGILIVGVQFLKDDIPSLSTTSNPNGPGYDLGEGILSVHSQDEVDSFYQEKVPGLKQAEELGLLTTIDDTISLTNDSSLHIEKIWYHSLGMEIFYSIDLPDADLSNKKLTAPGITDLWINGDSDENIPKQYVSITEDSLYPREGVIYNGRFYHHIRTNKILGSGDRQLNKIEQSVQTNLTIYLFDEEITLNNIEIPIYYDKENDEPTITTRLSEGIKDDLVSIKFNRMDIGINYNHIYGNINIPDKYKLNRITGSYLNEKDNQYQQIHGIPNEFEPDSFRLSIPAFETVPEELELRLGSVVLSGNESFEFSLDVSDYQDNLSKTTSKRYGYTEPRKVGQIQDTAIYLESALYDHRGIFLTLRYDPLNENQELSLYADKPSTPKIDTNTLDMDQPLLFTGTNEKGEEAKFGERGKNNDNSFYILLKKDYVMNSETINIKVDNVLYENKIDQSLLLRMPSM